MSTPSSFLTFRGEMWWKSYQASAVGVRNVAMTTLLNTKFIHVALTHRNQNKFTVNSSMMVKSITHDWFDVTKVWTGVTLLIWDLWRGIPLQLKQPSTQLLQTRVKPLVVSLCCMVSSCWHWPADLDSKRRYVLGVALGNVTVRRTDAYVRNSIWEKLNSTCLQLL